MDSGLDIYGLLERSMIAPKVEPGMHHIHGLRWLLECPLLNSRV